MNLNSEWKKKIYTVRSVPNMRQLLMCNVDHMPDCSKIMWFIVLFSLIFLCRVDFAARAACEIWSFRNKISYCVFIQENARNCGLGE